jgi:hypothetical protein
MTDEEIKASHLKSGNSYGQNASPLASSLLPEETKSPIADVSPPQVAVPGLRTEDTLTHRVKMGADGKATEYAAHDSMRHRSINEMGSGKIPATTHRAR